MALPLHLFLWLCQWQCMDDETYWRMWRQRMFGIQWPENHSADHVAHPQEAPLWRWVAQSGPWFSSLATTQAAGRHCANRLCWTSTTTTHGRKSWSSKTSRGVELSQIVVWVAQQVPEILHIFTGRSWSKWWLANIFSGVHSLGVLH